MSGNRKLQARIPVNSFDFAHVEFIQTVVIFNCALRKLLRENLPNKNMFERMIKMFTKNTAQGN
jgi:hypothetical protein